MQDGVLTPKLAQQVQNWRAGLHSEVSGLVFCGECAPILVTLQQPGGSTQQPSET